MHDGFFYQAFIYLSAAVIAVPIAKRLGLGSVLGYLIAGIAIGPYGLALIGEEGEDVMHFAEFGVVMMLFLIGLELQPSLLWRMRGPILGMGGLQVAVTTGVVMAIAMMVGLTWNISLAIGMILALSSTAIVLQTLNEKGLMKTDTGNSSFAVLLFQDIAVIPMLAVLPLLALSATNASIPSADGHSSWISGLPVWQQTFVLVGAVAGIVLGGRYITRPFFRFIASTRLREVFTAASLLLIIGIALLMSSVGLSPALGTFLAGVVLAGSEYRHELESDIEPFKGLLLGLFFIAVGVSIDFSLISEQPDLILSLVGLLIVVKLVVLLILGKVFRMGLDSNILTAFALAQGGEFAFVLFSFAIQEGVIPVQIAAPLIAVVALSMAATPLLMIIAERLILPRVGTLEKEEEREADEIHGENPVIIAGYGRFGTIVGRLLNANGIGTTVLDLDADNVDMLRKLDMKVFYGDASRHDLLKSAGADEAKLIVLAIDDTEKTLEIVSTVRKHFGHLEIMTRAGNRLESYKLLDAEVPHVYRETFDTSIRLATDAMQLLGSHPYQAHRAARIFRRRDEADLLELASMRGDPGAYITTARQRIQDMERTLTNERENPEEQRDIGWDSESLRADFGEASAD